MQGAALAIFRYASHIPDTARRSEPTPADSNVNFVLAALRETSSLVTTVLGNQRAHELRDEGAAMSMDEATSYALANIDRKLLARSLLAT